MDASLGRRSLPVSPRTHRSSGKQLDMVGLRQIAGLGLSGQLERETRLELATTCLEGRDSTN